MKIKFLAAGIAPDYYTINGNVIKAHVGTEVETYDFSNIPAEQGQITIETDSSVRAVRKAEVNDSGELEVTLCQKVGPGHWSESGWVDSSVYNPEKRYVEFNEGKRFSGIPVYYTINGKQVYGASN